MTPCEHIDYIADNGLCEWCVYGLKWVLDCLWCALLAIVLMTIGIVCVVVEMFYRWKDRRNEMQNHWRDC